jgi:hypothetical protein
VFFCELADSSGDPAPDRGVIVTVLRRRFILVDIRDEYL